MNRHLRDYFDFFDYFDCFEVVASRLTLVLKELMVKMSQTTMWSRSMVAQNCQSWSMNWSLLRVGIGKSTVVEDRTVDNCCHHLSPETLPPSVLRCCETARAHRSFEPFWCIPKCHTSAAQLNTSAYPTSCSPMIHNEISYCSWMFVAEFLWISFQAVLEFWFLADCWSLAH